MNNQPFSFSVGTPEQIKLLRQLAYMRRRKKSERYFTAMGINPPERIIESLGSVGITLLEVASALRALISRPYTVEEVAQMLAATLESYTPD